MTFKEACLVVTKEVKESRLTPYKTGRLKFHAMKSAMENDDLFHLKYDSKVAPYVEYLQEGTKAHDIPRAFGRPLPFGIGGRFGGKFHPGSFKKAGFIDATAIYMVDRLAELLGGKVKW